MKSFRHITAFLLVYLVSAFNLTGAKSLEFIFEHYSSDEGLPHNSICDIHQDSRGYLWLCTWYGLSRYDGKNFVNYTMQPGDYSNLSHNRILTIKEDVSGYLWVTTYDWHLYRFDVDEEVFISVSDCLKDTPYSNSKVTGTFCDSRGGVWVSLHDAGLVRFHKDMTYDMYMNTSTSNIGHKITDVFEDSDCNIYVASEVGLTMINTSGVSSLMARNIDVIAFAEREQKLFFACPDQLLVVNKDSREQQKIEFGELKVGEASSMTLTGEAKNLYVGFKDNAVALIDATSLDVKLLHNDMGRVRYLYPDSSGLLWIATERTGIWSYDGGRNAFKHYEHSNNVMSYYTDTLARVTEHNGRVWVKMNNYGFGYYDRNTDEIIPLNNVKEQHDCRFLNGVACYTVDDSGVLWMSTVGRGLERVTIIAPKVEKLVPPSKSDDLKSSSEIRAMLKDSKGNLWVAAKSRELFLYSPDLSECTRFSDISDVDLGVIYSIFEDRDGNIWLGTKGDGLIRMTNDGKRWRFKKFRHTTNNRNSISSDNIYSVEQDHKGRIWVGTYGGSICMLNDSESEDFVTVDNNFPDYPQEAGDRVRYLHCMPDGRMLVATVGGLILFEPIENPELTVFHLIKKIPGDPSSLGNNDVIHIFTDSAKRTWLCTFGGGLNRLYFDKGKPRFDVISTEDGLLSNIVQAAVEDNDGKIWMSTEVGLSIYDPNTSSVRNITRHDGVAPVSYSEATCAKADDGSLLFGTYDNIHRIIPKLFTDTPRDYRMAVNGLYIDGKRVPFKGDIVIPHDYSFFRINFSSLNFGSRDESIFSYKLDGYDKKWISTNTCSATYSHIPKGKYVFKVAESFSENTDSKIILSVNIRVTPSIWNSTLARILYILLGLSIIAFLIKVLVTSMKLRSNIKMEKDLNTIKARFFTNVSHELRTPLTLILGGIDEIKRKTHDGAETEYSVNVVQKNAKRMLTLVNQLLDTRSIAEGKMNLKVSKFDVVKLVQNVYDDFRDTSMERQMEMRIIRSVDSLMVWGDAMRIEAMVYNLLSNAFKYTSDGGKIEVGVLYRDGDKEFRIMVKDNGIGVSKDKQKTIFEPFTKGTASAFKGMASNGIGLSFCKEITEIHSGKIWVESNGTSGSKFFVRLPLGGEIITDDTHGLSKYKIEKTTPDGALKVLVVEDNAELKIFIYNSLSDRYEVRDASNGKEALEIISQGWLPDIVITDLMMPNMDGMELTDRLRNDFTTSHIPIVMITAKHEHDTQLKAMKYGADGYIAKPFTMELLTARIENLLERRKMLISTLSEKRLIEKGGKVNIEPEEIVITDMDEQLIKKIMEWLEENVSNADITVNELAVYVGMGRTSMYNKVKGLTGKSPVEMIQEFRMQKATYYLKSGQYSVSETSYKVGFSDPGYFSRSFKKHFGISPADYIKKNRTNSQATANDIDVNE